VTPMRMLPMMPDAEGCSAHRVGARGEEVAVAILAVNISCVLADLRQRTCDTPQHILVTHSSQAHYVLTKRTR
jgi:hypothetical protein